MMSHNLHVNCRRLLSFITINLFAFISQCFFYSSSLATIKQKCLTTLDLTSLGVGSCCGTGMYLVAGMVAKSIAGPGVVLSFFIAAIASIFSGKNKSNEKHEIQFSKQHG